MDVDVTLLLHKPVVYGSSVANLAFVLAVGLHALCGAVAVVSSIVALTARKGRRVHLRAGPVFIYSMLATALTGIGIDVVRLTLRVAENHTHYPGTFMPSTYPARLSFLFAGICILYLARLAVPRRARPGAGAAETPSVRWLLAPAVLVALGIGVMAVNFLRYNPWIGSNVWMVTTFLAAVIVTARIRRAGGPGRPRVEEHRFAMLFLAAFAWWGALQGFGPAIGVAIKGLGGDLEPYVGDRPGSYTPMFWLFGLGWAPTFVLAGFLFRRHARRAALVLERRDGPAATR